MLVGRSCFENVVGVLQGKARLSLDTETTGLRPYHGDRLFSIAISDGEEPYYFNFHWYPDADPEYVLGRDQMPLLANLFHDPGKTWYMHNAKFDLAMLAREGFDILGTIHCTKAQARVVYNEHFDYSLEACAERELDVRKDDRVEKYITENNLWAWQEIPGKQQRNKLKFYDQVPLNIIAPYAMQDATITFRLGEKQHDEISNAPRTENVPHVSAIMDNERHLTKTVFGMEQVGIRIDREYCMRAARYEAGRAIDAADDFRRITGHEYKASPKLFAEVFASEKARWAYTEKGNPSFDSEVIAKFEHPAAKSVLTLRDAKAKSDFYNGFLWHADAEDRIHPNLNPDGTASGRFSSSEPNFQNLTDEPLSVCLGCGASHEVVVVSCPECGGSLVQHSEFLIRRAIIPVPGTFFIMPDYDQMEYKLMLEYAARMVGRRTPLIERVLAGEDVHQATADLVKEVSGIDIGRSKAKNGNFAKLYGAGLAKLAETLKCDLDGARAVSDAIEKAAPEIALFCRQVIRTAENRGYIYNWLGRRSYFPDSSFAYKAPNYLIQGGCADVVKLAMNRIAQALSDGGYRSKLLLQVHDELVVQVVEEEKADVPKLVHEIMEKAFPAKYLPLTVSMEYSYKSLADKTKGFPA